MIAILYPLKMDKNLSETYSSIYEALHPTVARNDAINKEKAMKAAKERQVPQDVRAASKRQMTAGGPKDVGANKYTTADKKTIINYNKNKMNNSHEPEGDMVEGYMSDDKKDHNTGGFRISQREADEARKRVMQKTAMKMPDGKGMGSKGGKMRGKGTLNTKGKGPQMASYQPEGEMIDEMRYNDGKSQERLKALSKKRGIPMKKMKKHPQFQPEGKFRREWEALKLVESDNYREQFDTWLDGIVEEGYDIDRWTDEELLDTFINENDLWESRESVSEALLSEADKKGKGSGKKDACYHKVKASASVWPSAYASGRLVQCRKKGAANYGNSKKEDFSDWRSDIQLDEKLEKGTKGEIGFRSGGQYQDTGKKTKDGTKIVKYVQSMTTDKVTVNNPPTKKSGGTKARKRAQSPYGKALGALSKHQSQQWDAERKMKDARKRGDTKEADKQWKKAQSSYDKRRSQSGKLFDKTGSFHDRADND